MSAKPKKQPPTPQIEAVPVEALIPYARNSRTHSDEQTAQIAASIREFGFTNPVLISADNDIIAGHGRVLADNKLALNAGWDEELLGLELADLREADFDLDILGFDAASIEGFLNPPEPNTPDTSTEEIDTDGFDMECTCPKCGFEFDPKKK